MNLGERLDLNTIGLTVEHDHHLIGGSFHSSENQHASYPRVLRQSNLVETTADASTSSLHLQHNHDGDSISREQHQKNGRFYNPVVMSYIRDDWIKQQVAQRSHEFTDFHSMKIYVGTWNVNGKKAMAAPSDVHLLREWITLVQGESPDILAIGFQEIVDLNAVNVVVHNQSQHRSQQWEETIASTLKTFEQKQHDPHNHRYKCIMQKHLVGILLLVYVKIKHEKYVRDVQGDTAGVGVMGVMGNKGGAAIRLKLYESTLCFVCSHLAAHRENVTGRNADFYNIVSKISFHEEDSFSGGGGNGHDTRIHNDNSKTLRLLDHDFIIWLGDLNYRITDDVSMDHCFARIQAEDYEYLAQHDQLKIEMARNNVFNGFHEGKLAFKPTYKFQPGTSAYERRPEKKLRCPAWCDRILWKSGQPMSLELLEYGCSAALELSDHKPVSAHFTAKIKYEVEEKRNKAMRDIMHQLDKWENENMPKVKIDGSVISFPKVFYMVSTTESLWVENVGQVVAHFRFIPKLEDKRYCKSWLSISPPYGMIPPMDKIEIKITAYVDAPSACVLTSGQDTLDDTMILRIENGRDYFVIVSGQYQVSCFGTSLEQLVHTTCAVRKFMPINLKESSAEESVQKIPKELWRIVDDLYQHGIGEKGIFTESGNRLEMAELRESLDTSSEFKPHSPHSMAEILVQFLQSLREPVIPEHLLLSCGADAMRMQLNGRALLNGLNAIHYNTFVYLLSFLREALKHSASNKLKIEKLAGAWLAKKPTLDRTGALVLCLPAKL